MTMEKETKKCPYCGEEILAIAKKCKYCGEWLNKNEEQKEEKIKVPCPICGEMIEYGTTKCPYCNESLNSKDFQETENKEKPTTTGTIKTRGILDYYFVEPFIKHYFKFRGRINRKHYWISILLWLIFTALIIILLEITHNSPIWSVILFVFLGWFFLSFIPIWAINLRRMRDGDSDLSIWAWWSYIFFTPFMLWWLVKPSEDELRVDNLLPDETPEISFKRNDKIILVTILVILIGGLCLSISTQANKESNYTQIEKKEKLNSAKLPDIRVSEPYVQEQSDEHVNIKAVIVNDNYTIVSFQIVPNEDETWITIDENTYIEANNKQFKMMDASGIPISPEKTYGLSAGEIVNFYLTFPPIPKDTKEINIIEEDAWWWRGIQLKK